MARLRGVPQEGQPLSTPNPWNPFGTCSFSRIRSGWPRSSCSMSTWRRQHSVVDIAFFWVCASLRASSAFASWIAVVTLMPPG